jgi:hypothetical protein
VGHPWNLITRGGLPPLAAIRTDIVVAALFGGIAAGASMRLAQRAEALPSGSEDERERLGSENPSASARAKRVRQRERGTSAGNG